MGEAGDGEGAAGLEAAASDSDHQAASRRRYLLIGGLIVVVLLAAGGAVVIRSLLRSAPPAGSLPSGVSVEQVRRDFAADQEAENAALGDGDVIKARGAVTGNALQDLTRQIQINEASGVFQRTQLMDVTTEVLQQADPNDPQTNVEVHQTGYAKNSLVSKRTGAVVAEQNIRFDTKDWLRPVDGRYAITDEVVSQQPGTPPQVPWALIALGAAVVLATVLAVAVVVRRRRRQPSPASGPLGAPIDEPPAVPGDLPAPLWAGGPGEGLGIRTMGGLQLWFGGEDRASVVLTSEVSGFIWLLLLVRTILNPDGTMLSDELAEEVFPKLARENQLGRMRGRRFDIRRFPEPLAGRIPREGSILGFDLAGCRVDAVDLLDLARSCVGRAILSPLTVQEAEQLLGLTSGRFLPFWEVLVKRVEGADGASFEPVEVIQNRLDIARADILGALGATHVATGQTQRAVEVLEEARRMRPEREDIANQLVVAYRAAGRDAEADRVLEGLDLEV